MMNKEETEKFEKLQKEVSELRKELKGLQEFVKALYSMIDEEGQCEGTEEATCTIDFGRLNT